MRSGDAGISPTRGTDPHVVCAGLIVADIFVPPLQRLPAEGELVATDDFLLDAGGCAANTATTLALLGVPTALAARVGSDELGRWLRTDLAEKGVSASGVLVSDDSPTSKTIILPVAGEDRRYIHAFGANADLTAADIRAVLEGAQVLAVGGFLALPALRSDELAELFEESRDSGTRTVLDVVVPRDAVGPEAAVRPVLPHVDCIVPNQDEAEALTGEKDPAKQAEILLRWGCGSVAITCGADGAFYADAEQTIRVRPPSVDVVDASGAGDAFTAGMIVGLLEGWPAQRQLQFATAVGASACRGLGCTTTIFTREEALAATSGVSFALTSAITDPAT